MVVTHGVTAAAVLCKAQPAAESLSSCQCMGKLQCTAHGESCL